MREANKPQDLGGEFFSLPLFAEGNKESGLEKFNGYATFQN